MSSRLWEAVTGRRRVKGPNLDALFGIPAAAVSLEAASGFVPTGAGSVCFRAAAGAAFHQLQRDVVELIQNDLEKPDVEVSQDEFGYTWLVVRREADDVAGLCTDLHVVNTTLVEQGFASGLLCTMVPFGDATGRRFGLVYLYQQGTFYAFAPTGDSAQDRTRDNLLEISVRDTLAGELPMEQDLARWMAVWGAPGL
jgi:PspA associated protein B